MTEAAFDLEWEVLGEAGSAAGAGLVTERAQVFGGWLVRTRTSAGQLALAFVADDQFRWDGEDFGDEYEEEDEEEGDEDEEYEEEDEDEDEDEEEESEEEDAK